jgi:glucokinase
MGSLLSCGRIGEGYQNNTGMRDGRFAISVDLGGTNLRVAAIDEAGRLLELLTLPTISDKGQEDVIDRMCDGILLLLDRWRDRYYLVGISLGLPGIFNLRTGIWVESPNLPGWANCPIRDLVFERLKQPFHLENDANLAALGEKWIGSGKDEENLIFITQGTGVGGGIILNGRIWHGNEGMAAELGHVNVYPDGRLCRCGNRGCLEEYASASAVVKGALEHLQSGQASPALRRFADSEKKLTAALIYRLAREGDTSSLEVFQQMGVALGIAIASFINILDIRLFVLGGGGVEAWDAFEKSMFDEVARRSYVYRNDPRQILKSRLGNQAGIFGGAYLAFQHAF